MHGLAWLALGRAFQFDIPLYGSKYQVNFTDCVLNPDVIMPLNGTNYECSLPAEDDPYEMPTSLDSEVMSAAKGIVDKIQGCTYYSRGYWVYELCHNATIRQGAAEKAGEGKYKWTEETNGFFLGAIAPSSEPDVELVSGQWMLKQKYQHGDTCDITGELRSADVLYFCDPNVLNEEIVTELESLYCVYEIFVATPTLCELPEFRKHDPPVNFIQCAKPDGCLAVQETGEATENTLAKLSLGDQDNTQTDTELNPTQQTEPDEANEESLDTPVGTEPAETGPANRDPQGPEDSQIENESPVQTKIETHTETVHITETIYEKLVEQLHDEL